MSTKDPQSFRGTTCTEVTEGIASSTTKPAKPSRMIETGSGNGVDVPFHDLLSTRLIRLKHAKHSNGSIDLTFAFIVSASQNCGCDVAGDSARQMKIV